MKPRKKVLIAPLDWGLGHAARCIPIIRELQSRDCEVLIASNGRSQYLLENEFPGVPIIKLPAYNPIYPVRGSMSFQMAWQLPKFFWAVFRERRKIAQVVKTQDIDLIISDQRYGCRNKKVKSIFITHQLDILFPETIMGSGRMANRIHRSGIEKFDECWIPAPSPSFIPKLTDGTKGLKTKYIGYLSRMEQKALDKKYKICVICSGPEPQRSIFEKMMEEVLQSLDYPTIIIRGKTEAMNPYYRKSDRCTIVNHFATEEMNTAIEESELVISRSGYSTVMDLAKLGKKAVLIPTPGQTEQEYIADELTKRGIAYSVKQSDFDLNHALKESEKFTGFTNFEYEEGLLSKALDAVL